MFVLSAARRRKLLTRTPVAVVLACAVGALVAVPASAKTPAEVAAETAPKVAGTPCTATAKACVDVRNKKAWLIKDGKIFRGPVTMSSGKAGQDTPTGNVFRVYRKDKDFKSSEFKLKNGQPAPMPWAVFFEDGGIAFHAGSPAVGSAGCVHLNGGDAAAFFNYLQLGDYVQVMNGPVASKPLTEAQKLEAANAAQAADHDSSDSDKKDEHKDKKHKKKKKKDKDEDDF
jgi:lipoprotein-anchoring transpeptidase ErfK/SrfK